MTDLRRYKHSYQYTKVIAARKQKFGRNGKTENLFNILKINSMIITM